MDSLVLRPGQRPEGGIDLTDARVGTLSDDHTSWPTTPRLLLRGFTYDTLSNNDIDVHARLRWLRLHSEGYVRQIYDQLAAAYRRAGDDEAARQVEIARLWRHRGTLHPARRIANWILYLTVGYGHRTWLAALWLAGLLTLGTCVFARAHPGHITPSGDRPPPFDALGYTLDVLLPIVDLGQQRAWVANGAAMYWGWALTAAGWVLTTAVVAGLTGVLKRG
ncbi:hypothetical protein [Streptomyces sp. NPDC127197]|uniref:hypothetical protein n=1 Tax=Streptomyces sp. NPDC127197 TaxID=3345388 RepID=UPI0036385213